MADPFRFTDSEFMIGHGQPAAGYQKTNILLDFQEKHLGELLGEKPSPLVSPIRAMRGGRIPGLYHETFNGGFIGRGHRSVCAPL